MAGITGKDAALTAYADALAAEAPKGRSLTQDALRRLFNNKAALVSIFVLAAIVLLVPALTSASLASADDGPGPFGVTAVATVSQQSARVGALFGAERRSSLPGGHFCTASVVHSPNRDLVVTAAHCLDGSGDGDLVFVPGYRDGRAPYGVWTVHRAFLPDGWAKGQDEDSDVAFAVLGDKDGKGGGKK